MNVAKLVSSITFQALHGTGYYRRPHHGFFRRRISGTALKRPSSIPFAATASTGLAGVILRWEAARALAQLVRGDAEEDLKAILIKQFSRIRGPIMITAAHVIAGGTRIDPAKSHLADAFVAEVLGDRQSFMAISAQQ